MVMDRRSRAASGEEAYQTQKKAGIRSMVTWTFAATCASILAHNTWPFYRRQTLPFKVFLISAATMSGLVIGAEGNLQEYEKYQRRAYNMERRWVKIELAKEGKIASEEEIARFIKEHPPSSYPKYSSLKEGKPFAYNTTPPLSPSTEPSLSSSTPASASVLETAPPAAISEPIAQEVGKKVVEVEGVEDPLVAEFRTQWMKR